MTDAKIHVRAVGYATRKRGSRGRRLIVTRRQHDWPSTGSNADRLDHGVRANGMIIPWTSFDDA